MSLFIMTLREILCDHPGCNQDDGNGGNDETAAELRARLGESGWRSKRGKDYCPEHAGDVL